MRLADSAMAVDESPSVEEATDAELVRRCLKGDEGAWGVIIDRYKRLIYSIPTKFGAPPDDANDIFQAVCVELVTELPKLRKPEALRAWLISITRHKALKWKTHARRQQQWERTDDVEHVLPSDDPSAATLIEDLQREQSVRDALAGLPDRCQRLVRLLFYGSSPMPYAEVARRLGLSANSIGFIRGRCLRKLEAALRPHKWR